LKNKVVDRLKAGKKETLSQTIEDDDCSSRIREELEAVQGSSKILVGLTSAREWFIAFQVKKEWYEVAIRFAGDYPYFAPRVFFVPPIMHANVNGFDGRVRIDLLGVEYRSTTTVLDIIRHLRGLMAHPGDGLEQPTQPGKIKMDRYPK
jgi:ubiquitin-protein ligase